MKLIIAGGREYVMTRADSEVLKEIHRLTPISVVVSGGAGRIDRKTGKTYGADLWGEKWAEHMGISVKRFPADWDKHKKAAGPIRNREMADYADAVILFKGGKGTQSMHDIAKEKGLTIYDFRGNIHL